MEKQIANTVKFTKNLHCKYSAEEIENLTVYNPLLKKFQPSEDWGSDDKTDCLFIGGFNVEVSENKARFFYGTSIEYGFLLKEPTSLIFIAPGNKVEGLIRINKTHFEKEYKRPTTMWELGMFINDYIYFVVNEMDECALDFQREMSDLNQPACKTTEDDRLPF